MLYECYQQLFDVSDVCKNGGAGLQFILCSMISMFPSHVSCSYCFQYVLCVSNILGALIVLNVSKLVMFAI